MSKYQAYPEYKDSGVEWLGQIPNDWQITKLKHIASIFGRIGFRGYTVNDIVNEGEGAIVLSPSNIFDGKFSLSKVSYLSWDKYYESPEIMVERNDILLVKTGSTYGKSSIIKNVIEPMTINPQMALIKKTKINPSFLAYWLSSELIKAKIEISNTGSGMPTMTQENINEFPITLPNKNYAEKIAAFLDHETAKIDTLIEKQQQLIELLKEKRQAVISHAVTKGLNPDAPMKNSGVEWLGEVPEHWDVCLFKHKCNEVTDGAHISPDLKDGAHYFVSIKDIKNGIINFDNALLTSSKSYDYLVKTGCMPFAGDILFSKDGTIGQTAITPNDIDFVVASSLIIIRPNRQQVVSEYLDFLLQSSLVQEQVESFIKGAALRRLSIQNLLKIFGVFPSLGEQKEIAEYIKNQLKKYSDLMIQANSQVKLLHERRTALISAAVTGKIDVRSWIAPTTSSDTNEAAQEVTA
ncbi:restriction endonuclease subunit S [Photobacterium damselae]|uniref:restriction endonuclease subunit S n=1 Tax=Photobacterium damselae TaxID=38293 RepID=UPI000D073C5B|nr:restriction endonuclease subunit S [Photobacterium damselae]PSB84785.1 restriction endonuclease subunit S [Photobacterium damselae subsp. damselae]